MNKLIAKIVNAVDAAGNFAAVVSLGPVDLAQITRPSRVLASRPSNAAQGAEIVEALVRSGAVSVVFADGELVSEQIRASAARTGTAIVIA